MIKFCRTCGFADLVQHACRLLRIQIDPDNDHCSKHQEAKDFKTCELCGNVIASNFDIYLSQKDDEWHILCGNCVERIHTCAACTNARSCAMQEYSGPLPRMVQKQIRQGNTILSTTVPNPEIIEITCKNGCKCFNAENGCMRQLNYCTNMENIFDE